MDEILLKEVGRVELRDFDDVGVVEFEGVVTLDIVLAGSVDVVPVREIEEKV